MLHFLSYGKFCIKLEGDWVVKPACHCFGREESFPLKQRQNVVWVYSSELEVSCLKYCYEGAVEFVANWRGKAVLDLTGESVEREESVGCSDLADSDRYQEES